MPEPQGTEPDPQLDFDVADALAGGGPINMTALLVRRFAWDVAACDDVPKLLTDLGLTHGTTEGMEIDHRDSHHRMHEVLPLEGQISAYAEVLGAVITKALVATLPDPGVIEPAREAGLARQNAIVILSGARAILAQLMYGGQIAYGPAAGSIEVTVTDRTEEGTGG